jgi:organic hydroperoxide reductase OsmC/OhrA
MTTFLSIAENSKLEFEEFLYNAVGNLDIIDGRYMMTEVILNATPQISNAADKEKATRILEKACLISNSIKAKVVLNPTII